MSGSFPTTVCFASMKVINLQPNLMSVSHSLVRQVRSRGGAQRWGIEVTYPPMLRSEFAPILGFVLKQRGQWDSFTLTLPALWGEARGIATGTPLVNGTGQTGRSIVTNGWTASQTGIMLAGDFIKFAGHTKVYMVTEDANSDINGAATLTIEPALIEAIADDEAITVDNVPFTVALASDMSDFEVNSRSHHIFKLAFMEVL